MSKLTISSSNIILYEPEVISNDPPLGIFSFPNIITINSDSDNRISDESSSLTINFREDVINSIFRIKSSCGIRLYPGVHRDKRYLDGRYNELIMIAHPIDNKGMNLEGNNHYCAIGFGEKSDFESQIISLRESWVKKMALENSVSVYLSPWESAPTTISVNKDQLNNNLVFKKEEFFSLMAS